MEDMSGIAPTRKLALPARAQRAIRHRLRLPYKKIRGSKLMVHFLNQKSKAHFLGKPPQLSPVQARILKDLIQDGISTTSIQELFHDSSYLEALQAYIQKLGNQEMPGRKKNFLKYLWGENIEAFEVQNPFNQLALSETTLTIVNAYMGLLSHFFFSSGNITIPTSMDTAAAGSQKWHRDPGAGDERIVKIFLYINDVSPESGPFEYIRKSAATGPLGNIFPFVQPDGVYPPPDAINAHPKLKKNIISAIGKAGTITFCDTTGLHRGGFSHSKERIMATAAYTSPGSIQGFRFKFSENTKKQLQKLPFISRYALGLEK